MECPCCFLLLFFCFVLFFLGEGGDGKPLKIKDSCHQPNVLMDLFYKTDTSRGIYVKGFDKLSGDDCYHWSYLLTGQIHTKTTRCTSQKSLHICLREYIIKKMPKIESETKFLMSIKGYNSVLICQNLPICNPRTLLLNIDSHTKFEENR